jgi:hypothetical protein
MKVSMNWFKFSLLMPNGKYWKKGIQGSLNRGNNFNSSSLVSNLVNIVNLSIQEMVKKVKNLPLLKVYIF